MAAVVSPPAPPKPAWSPLLTSEQFLAWLEPGVFADLIGGEIFAHSPVNLRHARLVNFLDHLLREYIEHEGLSELHRESVAVRLGVRETFMPDLAYFTAAQAERLAETHAPFAPTLVVEVLSPTTADRDLGVKFAAYERHGVQEYWILDPQKLEHRFHRREGDMLAEFAAGKDRVDAQSIPGFWVRRSWLDPNRLPRVADCAAEILGTRKPSRRAH